MDQQTIIYIAIAAIVIFSLMRGGTIGKNRVPDRPPTNPTPTQPTPTDPTPKQPAPDRRLTPSDGDGNSKDPDFSGTNAPKNT